MKKFSLFILSVCLAGFVQAQDTASFLLRFNHIALSVKDINRAAAFYKQVLSLPEITNRTKMEGIRWFSLGENKELHLISIVKEPVNINKAVHIALTTTNFDAFVKALEREHIEYSDWPGTVNKINIRADGVKQVFFRDPDGYWIEVNSVAEQ